MTNSPVIILVEPQMGENIGAAARVMRNFGLSDLRIVKPRDGWPNEKAIAMSAGGREIIENAKIFDSLKEAVADLYYICAVTARGRDMQKPNYYSDEIRDVFEAQRESGASCALVFGGERSGLSNDDVVLANSIVTIDASPEYSSLNLAQAVSVLAYEVSRAGSKDGREVVSSDVDLASKDSVLKMVEHFELELAAKGFFNEGDKKGKMKNNLRNIFVRNDYSEQEINILRGVIRALSK